MIETYDFELTGQTPFLMNADRVEAADELEAWRKAPENRKGGKPGDDRSPPWSWMRAIYPSPDGYMTMPSENIMTALRKAGSMITLKKQTTYKALSQSGLMITTEYCELLGARGPVPLAAVEAIRDESFARQAQLVKAMGFTLFVKRAAVGQSKNVRVRPRFDEWTVRGSVEVLDTAISRQVLEQMFELAGKYAGLGDWRPSAPKSPGPFGRFAAAVVAA